ncbi:MAG TPA: hypothetical protein VNL16_11095 [Chloroflexota bacterium]|nr:hypothetical protein [Chloroflexota bacterium]
MNAIAPPNRPRLTFATASWYFLRASGVAMLVLVLGHLFIMHYLNVPSRTDTAFVARRWLSLFWLGFDWLLLLTALLHGLAGLQTVARDYLHAEPARALANRAILALAVVFIAIGTAAILTFVPGRSAAVDAAALRYAWIGTVLIGLLSALATVTYLGALLLVLYLAYHWLRQIPFGRWSLRGQWAWGLHRLTGLGILGFLLIHVLDITLLPIAPAVYDRTIASYANPYLMPMEIALVAAVLYHALNGSRLIATEIWDRRARKIQGRLILAVLASTAVLVLPSIVVLLRQ